VNIKLLIPTNHVKFKLRRLRKNILQDGKRGSRLKAFIPR